MSYKDQLTPHCNGFSISIQLEGQVARWLEKLQTYEFKIKHRKGKSHRSARKRKMEEQYCKL